MRAVFGFIVVFAILIGFLIWNPWTYESEQLTAMREGDVLSLRWDGPIEAPMSKVLAAALRTNEDERFEPAVIRFELASLGGSIAEGESAIRVLEEAARRARLVTHVRADDECASMCVPIYLTGETRTAAPTALFMFHDSYAADPISGARLPQTARDRQAAARNFRRQFVRPAVDEAWARELRRLLDNEGEVWRTAEMLYAERSGIVTRLPRDD